MSQDPLELARELGSTALSDSCPSVSQIREQGTVNEVFHVSGAEGDVIVRLNGEPYRFGEFEKEAARMALARSHGVSVPEVLKTGIRGGFAYQVQSYVAGTHLEDSDLRTWEELGATVRSLHSIPPPDDENPWRNQVEYGICQLGPSDELRRVGLLTAGLSDELRARWSGLHDLPVGLSHRDLAFRNVLRAAGPLVLLDWGSAEFDVVPFADLGKLVGEIEPGTPPLAAFLSGYGLVWDDVIDTLRATVTLKAVDLCRWAIDRRPSELDRCLSQARWAIDFFLNDVDWEPRP